MSQRYNDNTKRPKPQDTQIYLFCRKIQQKVLGPGETAAGVTYLSMRIHSKSCHVFHLKVATSLLNGSRKGAVRT